MVASYLQLLQRRYADRLDSEADEYITYAVDGAARMKTLINDLLSYSRVSTRGSEFKEIDTGQTVRKALKNLAESIREKEADVIVSPLPKVKADEQQLVRVFTNIIDNAVKFRNERKPVVHIKAQDSESEWTFSVQDNGIGIAPEFIDRIFTIFQRLHNKEKYTGNGIGLSVANRIVLRHGGRMWVESQPDEGSTFYFTLPKKGDSKHA